MKCMPDAPEKTKKSFLTRLEDIFAELAMRGSSDRLWIELHPSAITALARKDGIIAPNTTVNYFWGIKTIGNLGLPYGDIRICYQQEI